MTNAAIATGGVFDAALRDARKTHPKFGWRYEYDPTLHLHLIEAGIEFRSKLTCDDLVLVAGDSPAYYLSVMTDEVAKRLQHGIDEASSDWDKVVFARQGR